MRRPAMELQARFHGVGVSAFGWLGSLQSRHERAAGLRRVRSIRDQRVQRGSRQTIAETWIITSTRTRWVRRGIGGHELSKPRVNVLGWSAERIGPRIIGAPQRGHAQVATVGASVTVEALRRWCAPH